jgi:hypothetical protein
MIAPGGAFHANQKTFPTGQQVLALLGDVSQLVFRRQSLQASV